MSNRAPNEIERELNDARARLDRTLDAIEHRFTPGQMFDQVIQHVRGGAGGFATNFSHTVQNNPVPITLLGVGLSWLIMADSRPERPSGSEGSTAGDKARHARDRAGQAASDARERMGRLGETGQEQTQRLRENVDYMLYEQPLVVGALGIALGAAVGAGLPATRREDAVMGPMRDDSVRWASEAGHNDTERAEPGAQAAREAAAEQAEKEGLESGEREKQQPRGSSAHEPETARGHDRHASTTNVGGMSDGQGDA